MEFKHLLAKSTKNPDKPRPEETLVGHTKAVIEAAMVFNEVLAEHIVSILGDGFNPKIWQDALFCSAWLHDLGKANDHFQKMMRKPGFRQGIRHETLGIVTIFEHLTHWLEPVWEQKNYPEWFWPAVLYAVSGHHLKFPDIKEREGIDVKFLGEHPEINKILKIGKVHFGLSHIPELRNLTYSLLPFGGIGETLKKTIRKIDLEFSL